MFSAEEIKAKQNGDERIKLLQEKINEMKKMYCSLKAEVASIDRRRKRQQKKRGKQLWRVYGKIQLSVNWTGSNGRGHHTNKVVKRDVIILQISTFKPQNYIIQCTKKLLECVQNFKS